MGFDPIMMAKINAMQKSGGMGRTEKTVLTFDGNIEGKEYLEALSVVKISDEAIELDSIVSIATVFAGLTEPVVYTKEKLTISSENGVGVAVAQGGYLSGAPLVVVVAEGFTEADENGVEHTVAKGTYACYANDEGLIHYTTRIECETIHPIDPKFIPGVCMPVVEIDEFPYIAGEAVMLSADAVAVMEQAVSAGMKYVLVSLTGSNPYISTTNFVLRMIDEFGAFIGTMIAPGFTTSATAFLGVENGIWQFIFEQV